MSPTSCSSSSTSYSSPTSSSRRQRTSGRSSATASSSAQASSSSSAPSSSKAVSPPHDPYYGHEETATTAARFIISLFACPEYAPASNNSSRRPSLACFIAYALHRTRLPPSVTTAALLLLSRLKARFPSAKGSSGHRLFLSSFMTASKSLCDDTYSNKSWVIVGQDLFSLSEVNRMEREYMSYLEWNCVTHCEELVSLEQHLLHNFSTCPPLAPTYTSNISTDCASCPSSHTAQSSAPSSSTSTPTEEYDAYPSPPCSPCSVVALSCTSSSNNSSPSAPSTPPTMYSLPPSVSAPTGIKHQHQHASPESASMVSRSW